MTTDQVGPCGATCGECPMGVLCHNDAGDFDPAEQTAWLAGELADDAEREVAAWLAMAGHEGRSVLGTPGTWAERGWAT